MSNSDSSQTQILLELEQLRKQLAACEQAAADSQRQLTALQKERDLLRILIDLLPNPIYLKDTNSRFLVANAAVARIMGVASPENLLGKSDHDFYPEEFANEYDRDERRVFETGEALINKIDPGVNADGTPRSILTTKLPFHDSRGQIIGLVGIGHDITERKFAEEELQRAHDELNLRVRERTAELAEANEGLEKEHRLIRALMDNLPHNIYFKDAESRFIRINKAMTSFFGLHDPREAVGKCDFDFFTSEHAHLALADEQEIIRTGVPIVDKEEQETWPDGHISWVSSTKIPLRDDDGEIIGTLGISRDITERKQVAEALRVAKEVAEAASRAKGAFLANMSHEIRTPLNAIIGMTELVLEGQLAPRQREFLMTVRDSGEALLAIINDILDFSKIEAGKLILDHAVFNLRDSLADTIKLFAVRADKQGLELAVNVHTDVPNMVVGDFNRLRQIIVNLVGNALKFTDEGEVVLDVEVQSQSEKDVYLHFTVFDTGSGIPKNKQKAIFEMFEQADSALTRRHGGTGLGLAIVARLVELMDGSVWVESEVGQGSRFHFTIRLALADAVIAPARELDSLRGIRVLIVDDNATNRRILDEVLRSWKMVPVTASGAVEAIQSMLHAQDQGEPYRLVLTDLHMPEVDGFMFAKQIRDHLALSSTVIMMLTSGDRPDDVNRCDEIGIAAHLLKPIKQSDLLEAIEVALGVRESSKDLFAPAEQKVSAKNLHVLLAEDSLVNQRLAVALLEDRGHRVTVVNNGREAVEKSNNDTFDLILMDVQMPEMDGLAATATIRNREKATGLHVPIIAMTAHALKGDREKCLAAGMDDYITKPIRSAVLFETIDRFFSDATNLASETAGEMPGLDSKLELVDWPQALQAFEGNRQILKVVVESAIVEIPLMLDAIRKAVATSDAKSLRLSAHTLKGALRYFGDSPAFEKSTRLEKMGHDNSLAGADAVVVTLEPELFRLTVELKEFLAREK